MEHKKKSSAVSVIAGEDGPISVWIAGKSSHREGFRERLRRKRFQKRRERAEASVTASTHTIDEVILYMKEKYGARELDAAGHGVREQRKCCREALILKYAPELLGELAVIETPADMNEENLKAFWEKIQERSRRADDVPEDAFPIDHHVYEIRREGGSLQVEAERRYGLLAGSFSGSRKEMRRLTGICRDIYSYYGVTQEDIDGRSERYRALVLMLAEGR